MSTTPHHPIAVIGGGLGGLTLACVLRVNGIGSAVFDLERDRHARTPGGMLDIHEESGQEALRAAGLHERFLAKVHPDGEAMRILDKHARVLWEEADDSERGRPEIDRGDLRSLLLDSLADGTVHWNSKVTGARPLDPAPGPGRGSGPGSGRHEVTLADGTTFTTDLLIGADGAWSRVRPLLSDAKPAYTGISFVELDLLDADVRHPAHAELIGGGMFFALGDHKGFLAHRETDGSLHVYTAVRADEEWLSTIDFGEAATDAAKAALLEHFSDWAPGLRRLVTDADGTLFPRRIHALPIGHRWERVPRHPAWRRRAPDVTLRGRGRQPRRDRRGRSRPRPRRAPGRDRDRARRRRGHSLRTGRGDRPPPRRARTPSSTTRHRSRSSICSPPPPRRPRHPSADRDARPAQERPNAAGVCARRRGWAGKGGAVEAVGSVAAALRARLVAWRRNQAVVQTVRATTAATIAYAVAVQVSPERTPPLTAPLTALLVVQVTLFATLKMGFRRVNAVLVGVLIAIGFSSLVGLSWWSLALVILAALIAGRLVRAHEFVNEVAISAMLILGVAGSTVDAWARVVDTLIGAAVGLLFNLFFAPPVLVRPAGESMEDLARRMRHLLLETSETLGAPIPVSRTTARLEEARRLDIEIAEVDVSLRQAEESLRFNPRVREAQLNSAVLRTGLDTLEVCAVILRVLARSLTDLSMYREEREPLIPERIAPDLEDLFAHVGGALVSFSVLVTTQLSRNAEEAEQRMGGELAAARDTRDKVARLLLEKVQENPSQWQHFGALLAQVDRVLDELSPEERSQRLMDELDRNVREQAKRRPRLTRFQRYVRSLRPRE